MNKTAHSRAHTECDPLVTSIHATMASFSAMRVKTTPSRLIQGGGSTTRRHIYSHSCFQQAHLVKLSSSKQQKIQKDMQVREESQGQPRKYILDRIIAKGAQGVVYKAHSNTQHHLAVKKVRVKEGQTNNELVILKNLHHPNIIQVIDHYFTLENNHQYSHLVTHYYPHTLKHIIRRQNTKAQLLPLYLYQILRGLAYLKQKGIMHRDLTPLNILVQNNTNKVVIADFGFAKTNTNSTDSFSYVVARAYRAPELIFGSHNYSSQVDMWAFGCIAVELLTGRPLFDSQSTIEQMLQILKLLGTPSLAEIRQMNPDFSLKEFQSLPKIRKRAFKDLINSSNNDLLDLLSKLFVYMPKKRMTAIEALDHPYFSCLHTRHYYIQNSLNPEELHIQLAQSQEEIIPFEEKEVSVAISSIKLQPNHKRLITSISQLSESTTVNSTIKRSGAKVFATANGLVRKLFV